MHYEGNIIRPPSESDSILLQVTTGCSRNKCTFCGAYKGMRFKIKSDDIIMNDISFASKIFRSHKRLFICDGDALIVPYDRLFKIMSNIKEKLPWIERVGIYANVKSINMKTESELLELRKLGLGIIYFGLESGDDKTLDIIKKGTTSIKMFEACKKVKSVGIKLSVTILLGIASKSRSKIHAEETGKLLSTIDPNFVGALSLMLIPGTSLYQDYKNKKFDLLNSREILKELRVIIKNTNLSNGLFHSNHASNYLPIRAKLPSDKSLTIKLIDSALSGKISLRSEKHRAL